MEKMTRNSSSLAADPCYAGVPECVVEVYGWAYVDPKRVRALGRKLVVSVLSFLNDQRLTRACPDEVEEGMRVWLRQAWNEVGIASCHTRDTGEWAFGAAGTRRA
ncbi:MAG: hypothetical protein LBD06_03295 [Candidatus Accumulibacter sp.]|jgi:hypothetical protein|nr:hypothetical protein [Accumulibacter sp.]